jgi:hypothetical protein
LEQSVEGVGNLGVLLREQVAIGVVGDRDRGVPMRRITAYGSAVEAMQKAA